LKKLSTSAMLCTESMACHGLDLSRGTFSLPQTISSMARVSLTILELLSTEQ